MSDWLPARTAAQPMTAYELRKRRISQIEDSLARPGEEGPEWRRRMRAFEQELEWLKALNRYVP